MSTPFKVYFNPGDVPKNVKPITMTPSEYKKLVASKSHHNASIALSQYSRSAMAPPTRQEEDEEEYEEDEDDGQYSDDELLSETSETTEIGSSNPRTVQRAQISSDGDEADDGESGSEESYDDDSASDEDEEPALASKTFLPQVAKTSRSKVIPQQWKAVESNAAPSDKPTEKAVAPSPARVEKKVGRAVITKIVNVANAYGVLTPEIDRWLVEAANAITGEGRITVVVSPNVRSNGATVSGYALGFFKTDVSGNKCVVPLDFFDSMRQFYGLFALRVPSSRSKFYESMQSVSDDDLRTIMTRIRDSADFQFTESFVGIYKQRDITTEWSDVYWILVQDGDTVASEECFKVFEKYRDKPIFEVMAIAPVDATRERCDTRRKNLALSVMINVENADGYNGDQDEIVSFTEAVRYNALEPQLRGHVFTQIYHGVEKTVGGNDVYVHRGMTPVHASSLHLFISHPRDGITVLVGENDGDTWAAANVSMNFFPVDTSAAPKKDVLKLGSLRNRFVGPVWNAFPDAPRTTAWRKVEAEYGRKPFEREGHLEPVCVAISEFKGLVIEDSLWNEL